MTQPSSTRTGNGVALAHPHRRLRLMFIVVLFVFSLFAVQLLRLQAVDASPMASAALKARSASTTVPAVRGNIVDANGVVLATSLYSYNVSVDQRAVTSYTKTVDGVERKVGVTGAAADLAPLLGTTVAALTPKLTGSQHFVYIGKNVPAPMWRKISALGVNGVYATLTTTRSYPVGQSAASLVGIVSNDQFGVSGVEQLMNSQLKGKSGKSSYQKSASGQQIPTAAQTLTPAVPGSAVKLSINSDLQWFAQNAIAQKVISTRALSGSAVVMNAKTGQLLAVANYPTIDPANLGSSSISNVGNRAFDEVFEPGSTSKVMTMSAALEEGIVTPTTPVTVPPYLIRAQDTTFHDSHPHGVKHLTVAGVLAESSNIGTIKVGEQMSPTTMRSYLAKFGLGSTTGVGLVGESPGLLAQAKDWNASQRYTVLFGQGLSLTAVQAVGVFQTIANNGLRMAPRLVEGTTAPDGTYTPAPAATPVRVVSPAVATEVRDMLEGVVGPEGTAGAARVPGYRVAGKTGTADRYDPVKKKYSGKTASFVGFAPVDDPAIVVGITLQRPVNGYFGGTVAAPVFSTIMKYALAEYQVPPTGTPAAHIQVIVPNSSTVSNLFTSSSTTVVRHPVAPKRPAASAAAAKPSVSSPPTSISPSGISPPTTTSSPTGSSAASSPTSAGALAPLQPGLAQLRPR